jgi:acetyl-CoA carboxylase carboxyltransferase component
VKLTASTIIQQTQRTMAINPNLIEDLNQRRTVARQGGGLDKQRQRRSKGLLAARERLEYLFEAGTFQEFGMHAQHTCTRFGMAAKQLPGDGVVCGTGLVEGSCRRGLCTGFYRLRGLFGSNSR